MTWMYWHVKMCLHWHHPKQYLPYRKRKKMLVFHWKIIPANSLQRREAICGETVVETVAMFLPLQTFGFLLPILLPIYIYIYIYTDKSLTRQHTLNREHANVLMIKQVNRHGIAAKWLLDFSQYIQRNDFARFSTQLNVSS